MSLHWNVFLALAVWLQQVTEAGAAYLCASPAADGEEDGGAHAVVGRGDQPGLKVAHCEAILGRPNVLHGIKNESLTRLRGRRWRAGPRRACRLACGAEPGLYLRPALPLGRTAQCCARKTTFLFLSTFPFLDPTWLHLAPNHM